MNNRTKELAKKAVEETQLLMIMEYKNFEGKLFEKFAELIVKECASVCDDLQKWPATEPRHCAEDIRIHFGIK